MDLNVKMASIPMELVRTGKRANSGQLVRKAKRVRTVGRYIGRAGAVASRFGRFVPYVGGALTAGALGYGAYKWLTNSTDATDADGAPAGVTSSRKAFAVSRKLGRPAKVWKAQKNQLDQWKWCYSKTQGAKTVSLSDQFNATSNENECAIQDVFCINGVSDAQGATCGLGDAYIIKKGLIGDTDPGQLQKICINSCFVEVFIRNVGETTAFLELYDFKLKKDIPRMTNNPLTIVQALQRYQLATQVSETAWTQEDFQDLTFSPFECEAITKFVTITKVTRVQLNAGENFSLTRFYRKRYIPEIQDLTVDNIGINRINARKGFVEGMFYKIAGQQFMDDTTPKLAAATSLMRYVRRNYNYSKLYDTYNQQSFTSGTIP